MRVFAAFFLASIVGLACAQPAPKGPDGFRNNYPHPDKESFWAWKWEQMRDGLPKPPPGGWNLPAVKTDPVALSSPAANPSVTWIGHATMLVRLGGKNILFDPMFSDRASPVGFESRKPLSSPIASVRLSSRFFSVTVSIFLSSADSTGASGAGGRLRM